ncbi:MAG: hypothetical protein JSS34_05575 [Proteobacteria bacterium]|nr:hypothetical protein [Pseudomonadota bacterium]
MCSSLISLIGDPALKPRDFNSILFHIELFGNEVQKQAICSTLVDRFNDVSLFLDVSESHPILLLMALLLKKEEYVFLF